MWLLVRKLSLRLTTHSLHLQGQGLSHSRGLPPLASVIPGIINTVPPGLGAILMHFPHEPWPYIFPFRCHGATVQVDVSYALVICTPLLPPWWMPIRLGYFWARLLYGDSVRLASYRTNNCNPAVRTINNARATITMRSAAIGLINVDYIQSHFLNKSVSLAAFCTLAGPGLVYGWDRLAYFVSLQNVVCWGETMLGRARWRVV